MKKLSFAMLAVLVCFTLAACKNPWVTELLKAPSELSSLEVTAYVEDFALQGGAAFEPGFSPAERDYAVYVPLETTRFIVNPMFEGKGTVLWKTEGMDEAADPRKLEFNFYGDELTLELTLTVERENMNPGEYRLTVTRTDNLPPPKVLGISVSPSVGTYFLNCGVAPVVSVQVEPPADGGTVTYQWFRNEEDNNVTGSIIHGATNSSYTLSGSEITQVRTLYYYVEITKTLDGKTSKLESPTRPVTFVNRNEVLDVKSAKDDTYWVKVPAGEVPDGWTWVSKFFSVSPDDDFPLPWSTDGFEMAKYPVTYELWEFVRVNAEKESYRFANKGNQGARHRSGGDSTNFNPQPVGTPLHPVTMIGWRDAIVWCNAYSEMEGKEPVYLDNKKNVLQDSRQPVESLIDDRRTVGRNGYRLPTVAEDEYAARGADPDDAVWNYRWPGTDDASSSGSGSYVWGNRDGKGNLIDDDIWSTKENVYTGEVGSLNPNTIGLYDMIGMVQEYAYASPALLEAWGYETFTLGDGFKAPPAPNSYGNEIAIRDGVEYNTLSFRNLGMGTMTYGFRLIRYEVE